MLFHKSKLKLKYTSIEVCRELCTDKYIDKLSIFVMVYDKYEQGDNTNRFQFPDKSMVFYRQQEKEKGSLLSLRCSVCGERLAPFLPRETFKKAVTCVDLIFMVVLF